VPELAKGKIMNAIAAIGALFMASASCETPQDVVDTMLSAYPESYVEDETTFTDNIGEEHYVVVFRSAIASTDFVVFFDSKDGQWCASRSMEAPKQEQGA